MCQGICTITPIKYGNNIKLTSSDDDHNAVHNNNLWQNVLSSLPNFFVQHTSAAHFAAMHAHLTGEGPYAQKHGHPQLSDESCFISSVCSTLQSRHPVHLLLAVAEHAVGSGLVKMLPGSG